jgi:hypothetical protein
VLGSFRFPSRTRRRKITMVMGYFDDGGTMNRDLICMAGYLANDENWEAMTTGWDVLLKKVRDPISALGRLFGRARRLCGIGVDKGRSTDTASA